MCCRNCTRLHDPVCRARSETRKAVRYLKSPQAGGAKEREPKCTFIQSPGSLTQRPYMSVIPSERCGFSSPFAPAAVRKHVRLYLFSKSGNNPLFQSNASRRTRDCAWVLSRVGCIQPAEGDNSRTFSLLLLVFID